MAHKCPQCNKRCDCRQGVDCYHCPLPEDAWLNEQPSLCEDCEVGGPFPIVSHGEQMNDYLSSGYAGADGCSPDF